MLDAAWVYFEYADLKIKIKMDINKFLILKKEYLIMVYLLFHSFCIVFIDVYY